MNQEVTDYIQAIKQPWQKEVCTELRSAIQKAVPDAEEIKQWSKPHYKKNGKYLCTYFAAKDWVNFTILNVIGVDIPEGFFDPEENPARRTIKIREGQDVNYDMLVTILKACGK